MNAPAPTGRMTRALTQTGAFADAPMSLIDVGCAGGVMGMWGAFLPHLTAHGCDPKRAAIETLNRAGAIPGVTYHHCYIGLPESHSFVQQRKDESKSLDHHYYFCPWDDFSLHWVKELKGAPPVNADSIDQDEESIERITIDDLINRERITNVDFIKIDTDGYDYEALLSAENSIQTLDILGFRVECNLNPPYSETADTIYNIDPFMRKHGYILYAMETGKYARRDLPSRFTSPNAYNNHSGQLSWADLIYLRNGASPHYEAIFGKPISVIQALKLACLFELHGLPDCAAGVINVHKARIAELVDPTLLLNALVPPVVIDGRARQMSYEQYLEFFQNNLNFFIPPR